MQYPNHLILDTRSNNFQKKDSFLWSQAYLKKFPESTFRTSNETSRSNILKTNFLSNSHGSILLRTHLDYSGKSSAPKRVTLYTNYDLFDINFLRKERLYTKLKYSRCPQYDIVSGGWAALFAALLGFLICEKFGIELVDSGDFYTALMYGIFLVFSLRPLMKFLGKDFKFSNIFIIPNLLEYFMVIYKLSVNFLLSLWGVKIRK